MSDKEVNHQKINEFFDKDFINYGSYTNYRMLCSYIDGLKPSARKVLYTMIEKNIKEPKKVAILTATVLEFTEYLHGQNNLVGVIAHLAQKFTGANNICLLKGTGNLGTRCNNAYGADRYIFASKGDLLDDIFMSEDSPVLIEQIFEGSTIEPKFYVPLLPMALINGSDGVATGFAQKILPRDPLKIIEAIRNIVNKKPINFELTPYYKGFEGSVVKRETIGYEIIGKISIDKNSVIISELPVGYELASYREVLDSLEEKKEIQSYIDKTDTKTDKFLFEIKLKNAKQYDQYKILDNLKLIKRVVENFTFIDENNRIIIFNSIEEILENFINVRLKFYQKRKEHQIFKKKEEIEVLRSKLTFIREVVKENLQVIKKPKKEIIEQIEPLNLTKIDDSYEYLLKMPIYSLTKEKLEDLMKEYKDATEKLNILEKKEIVAWYLEDLANLEIKLKKVK